MSSIENTGDRDPLIHLAGMSGGGGITSYVEEMEAAGQAQIVASTSLPIDSPWPEFEALGVRRVGEPDDLFVEVELPTGWTRESSDHAMWSYVCDERGIRRIAVFYKAAYYDRRASGSVHSVGYFASTDAIYGDDEVTLPDKWELLTDEERAEFVAAVRNYIEQAERDDVGRKVYGPRVPRARAALQLAGAE